MVKLRKLTVFIVLSLCVLFINAQDIKVVSSGQGMTEDKAVEIALRNALERTFGTFISSSTKIENDILVSDEIVFLTQGCIKKYDVIDKTVLNDSTYSVLLEAVVSLSNLSSYCESKGMNVKFDGENFVNTFIMNHNIQMNNKKNEEEIINNLSTIFERTLNTINIYDYQIKKVKHEKRTITFKISAKENQNGKNLFKLMMNTINSIKLSKKEKEELLKLDINHYNITSFTCLYLNYKAYLPTPYNLFILLLFYAQKGNFAEIDNIDFCDTKSIDVRSRYTVESIDKLINSTWNKENVFKFKLVDNNGKEYSFDTEKIDLEHKKNRSKKIDSINEYVNKTEHEFNITFNFSFDQMKEINSFEIIPL